MVPESAIQKFKGTLRGQSLCPGEQGYDAVRAVPNAMIDRRPALIARCAGAADVIACVRFAREHDLVLSVRGGGHSVAGKAVCDGALMVDLSAMRGIRVDPAQRTVRAEPGLKLGEFDRETQAFGLATTLGVVSATGIAGLTLGAGWGHLHAPVWPRGGQRHRRGCGHCGWRPAQRERCRKSGPVLGHTRRQWQLRNRDLPGIPSPRGRSRVRRRRVLPGGKSERSAAFLAGVRSGQPGRASDPGRFL